MLIQGTVQTPSNISFSDGDQTNAILGKQAEVLMAPLHTESYTQTYRGYTFHASCVATGIAIPIYSTTAPTMVLWNPIGSGKNLSLQNVVVTYTSGTATYGSYGLCYLANCGSTVGTGAPFTAFTPVTPVNGLLGGGAQSVAKVSVSATNGLTTTGTWFYTLGSFNLENATTTAHATTVPSFPVAKGVIILAPGTAVYIGATLASVALYCQTISWAEVPT